MVYALVATLFVGFSWFFQKVVAEQKALSADSFLFYSYFSLAFFWISSLIVLRQSFEMTLEVFMYGTLITAVYISILQSRIKCLNYVDSSTYFINYRIFSSILLLIFGQILFNEIISLQDYVGILLWFLIFFLLLEKKEKTESKSDFYKGLSYIFLWVILITVAQLLSKSFVILGHNIASLFVVQWLVGMVIMRLQQKENKKIWKVSNKKQILFLLINGVFFYCSALFNTLAFQQWDVAIVYKIISYSLFIPIILSVIFYKEKITVKKWVAFLLTIVSILLFV